MRAARLRWVILAAPVVSGAECGRDNGVPDIASAAPTPTQSAFAEMP
jgi:hypothetical protein